MIGAGALAYATLAHAHGNVGDGGTVAVQWSVLGLIVAATILYARGVRVLWRARVGRGVSVARVAAFAAGIAALAITAGGPLEAAASSSFAAHMAQHEALMLVVAPLVVAGAPLATWAWALPHNARSDAGAMLRGRTWVRVWRSLSSVTGASVLQLVVVLAWHVPRLFDAALARTAVHALQHACFVGAALLFSWAIVRAARGASALVAIAWLFVTMIVTGALGAALAFAPSVWYSSYAAGGAAALESQQLGGALMWVPGGLGYMAAAIAIGARALARPAPRLAVGEPAGDR